MVLSIVDLINEEPSYVELVRWLHPEGLPCPRCHRAGRMRVDRSYRSPAGDYRRG